ncbi:hypothetical protein [Pseudobacillus wudalianchiensis]|nr:hypothetical protein [Bacillus wudalianchiensis]
MDCMTESAISSIRFMLVAADQALPLLCYLAAGAGAHADFALSVGV